MFVSIIIVNYNTGKILQDCVESVFEFELKDNFEIIIVDNCSTDDSKKFIDFVTEKYDNIRSVFNSEKISFSESNNKGIVLSKGEIVLIMNPDIIFTESLFEKLSADLAENNLGAVSPMLLGSDGKFQNRYFQKYPSILQFVFFYSIFAKLFQSSKTLTKKYLHIYADEFKDKIEYVEQIPCAFYFTTRDILDKTGLMDDRYELFFEDVDLSYQTAKIHKLAVDTSIKVTHLGGASFKTSDDYWLYGRFIISMITFFNKNYSGINTTALKITTVLNSHLILISEKILSLFNKQNKYRSRKHKYFLDELKKVKI